MVHDILGGRHPSPSDLASQVADLLQAVTHRLRRESRADLGARGVTMAHMRALRVLARTPTAPRMSELADALGIARRSATSVVDELEARHLVDRTHDPADRRAVTISMTAAGRDLVDEVGERRRRTTVGMLGVLSDAELTTLRDLLGRILV